MSHVQYSLNYPPSTLGDRFGETGPHRPNPHRGQDIAPPGGGPVLVVAEGTLLHDGFSQGLGNVAVVAHADGKFSGYAHMVGESPVRIGSLVARGQPIGTIGNTGKLSQGRHLHLTMARSLAGAAGGFDVIDPLAWIQSHAAEAPGVALTAHSGLHTATEFDGEPGVIYWTKVQSEVKVRTWYTGPVDGKPGDKTFLAHRRLQAAILNSLRGKNPRTSTEDDGAPGKIFWTLAQTISRSQGYAGPIDGIRNPGAERAMFKLTGAWLNRHGR